MLVLFSNPYYLLNDDSVAGCPSITRSTSIFFPLQLCNWHSSFFFFTDLPFPLVGIPTGPSPALQIGRSSA
jgi:hypothetical protein